MDDERYSIDWYGRAGMILWNITLKEEQKNNKMERNGISYSNRKVEGETIHGNKKRNPKELHNVDYEKFTINPTLRQKVKIKWMQIKQSIKDRIMGRGLKMTEKVIKSRVSDSTWYGKVLFAILDVLPIPNIHEIWKAVQKELPDGTFTEKLKLFWEKVDGIRTVIAIIISILVAFEYIN